MIRVEFPNLINNKNMIHLISSGSSLEEQVLKLFHYSSNGSVQIIPVNLTTKIEGESKTITVFISTLSEKTSSGYKKSINKRDKEKVPEVVINNDPISENSVMKTTWFKSKWRSIRESLRCK